MAPITDGPREIAPDVWCLGPRGRTQTDVYLVRSEASWTLVDAGWEADGPRIVTAAASLFGADARPSAILLTHVHPDHSGSALALARRWEATVWMHPAELPIASGDFTAMARYAGPLDRWVVLPIMRAMGRRRREATLARSSLAGVARGFDPGSSVPGLPGWQCIPTPGHTPGHVSYFRPADRLLITGDALVTLRVNSVPGLLRGRAGLSGPPRYTSWDWRRATDSVATLSALEPDVLAPGHGRPLAGPDTATAVRAFAARVSGLAAHDSPAGRGPPSSGGIQSHARAASRDRPPAGRPG
jgi:glyoxylase-like metal-dependent hydrolase (beta-lactamase superfamily II)